MKKHDVLVVSLILGLLLVLIAKPGSILAGPQDFDGDSYADLAIGVPYENVSDTTDAGSVSVIYGTSSGLSGTADEYWQQNYLDGSDAEVYEYFGVALAIGDFDGDSYYDLAVGVSHEDVGSVNQAGAVNIIYGAASGGLDVARNQYWNQDESGMGGAAETNDHFGRALAAGDFNGDGYHDLAIGIPEEDIGTVVDAGGMMVMYGSSGGLTAAGTVWNQEGGAETGDQYGSALVAADFDNDGYDDLAVGVKSEDLGSIANAGAVEIYYGSTSGLITRVNNDFWHQDRTGIADTADDYDLFGSSLTAGDFNGDGYSDLAVGVPYEDTGSPSIGNAGAVNVFYGSLMGIEGAGSDYWHQDVGSIHSLAEADDRFGFALTAGDFDGDGYDDLAVGVPYEHWNDPDTGIVQIIYGTADGLTDNENQLWRQDATDDFLGMEEADDRFGYALAVGNFDGDEYDDLAIGVPYESIETTEQAGAVNVLYGSSSKLTTVGNQVWYQGNDGLQGTPETGDRFGYALAALPVDSENPMIYLPLLFR